MPISLDGSGSISGISTFSFSDEIIHTGDTNTAIKFPAADTISFETNGAERLRIRSDGKVGIGTDMVGAPASNYGFGFYRATGTSYLYTETGQSGASAGLRAKAGTSDFTIFTTQGVGQLAVYDNTNSAERFRIDSSGRLLVGQTSAIQSIYGSPPPRFSVSTTTASPAIFATYSNNTFASRVDLIKSRNTTVGSHTVVQAGDALGEIYFGGSDGDQFHGGALIQAVVESGVGNDDMPANLRFYTNGGTTTVTERLRIDSSGNIGMNTTTAGDSTGNCRAYTFSRSDANGQVRIILKNQGTGFGNGAGYHQGIDGSNVFIENRSDGGYIDFATNHSASITTKLRINSDGDVIIGSGGSWSYPKALNVQGSSGSILSLYNADTTSYAANTTTGIEFKLLTGNTGNQSGSCEIRAFKENGTNGNNARGLGFYTGGNGGSPSERLRISPEGYVNKPYHPAFAARLGSQIDLTTAGGTDCVFGIQEFDNSGSYNTSNGRFTAPVAGKYYFGVQIYAGFDATGVRVLHAHFRVNGVSVAQTDMFGGASNHGGSMYHPNAVGVMMRELNANDYVTWNIGGFSQNGSGTAVLYASTGCRFFGHLVA